MGGYFSSGEGVHANIPNPQGSPRVWAAPQASMTPRECRTPGLAPVSPRLGSSSGDMAGNVWGRQGGLVWGGEKGWGEKAMQGKRV